MENRKIENSSSKFQILKPSISSFDADDDMVQIMFCLFKKFWLENQTKTKQTLVDWQIIENKKKLKGILKWKSIFSIKFCIQKKRKFQIKFNSNAQMHKMIWDFFHYYYYSDIEIDMWCTMRLTSECCKAENRIPHIKRYGP
mgnify:CR=1 FL=1